MSESEMGDKSDLRAHSNAMNHDDVHTPGSETNDSTAGAFEMSQVARYVTVIVLTFVNLLNYMDRYTVAGVLDQTKLYFGINNEQAGISQSIFIIGYMIFSPIFGYCGDRYSRKYLMTGGIFFWSLITLSSSFVPSGFAQPLEKHAYSKYYALFVVLRGFVGIGEASYSTLAPTIISDMFASTQRSYMLMAFYFAIPFGSGLGYIIGSGVAELADDWRWALRVTPGLGLICALLILLVTKEPPRGMADHASSDLHPTSIKHDLISLAKNKSYIFVTLGFTCVAFVAGALAFFAPDFMLLAYRAQGNNAITDGQVSLYFGIITCAAGVIGISIGSVAAARLKRRYVGGDAIVCAFGLLTSAPFLFLALLLTQYSIMLSWVCVLIGMILVSLNWSLVTDIILYTVIPTRRSIAEAMQIFVSHLLGDAGSPYLLGIASDAMVHSYNLTKYKALQYSLYTCVFVGTLGGGFFLVCSLYIGQDKARATAITQGASEQEADAIISPVDLQTPRLDADYSDSDVEPLVL